MLGHEFVACVDKDGVVGAGGCPAIACCAAAAGRATGACAQLNGLALAAALSSDAAELHLFYDDTSPPLVCDADEIGEFRSFLHVSIVERLLERLTSGADLEVERPRPEHSASSN